MITENRVVGYPRVYVRGEERAIKGKGVVDVLVFSDRCFQEGEGTINNNQADRPVPKQPHGPTWG